MELNSSELSNITGGKVNGLKCGLVFGGTAGVTALTGGIGAAGAAALAGAAWSACR